MHFYGGKKRSVLLPEARCGVNIACKQFPDCWEHTLKKHLKRSIRALHALSTGPRRHKTKFDLKIEKVNKNE